MPITCCSLSHIYLFLDNQGPSHQRLVFVCINSFVQNIETPIGYAWCPLVRKKERLEMESDEQEILLPVAAELPSGLMRSKGHAQVKVFIYRVFYLFFCRTTQKSAGSIRNLCSVFVYVLYLLPLQLKHAFRHFSKWTAVICL